MFGRRYFTTTFNYYRILGLTNNFAYVVMLSAAFDILGGQLGQKKVMNCSFIFEVNSWESLHFEIILLQRAYCEDEIAKNV